VEFLAAARDVNNLEQLSRPITVLITGDLSIGTPHLRQRLPRMRENEARQSSQTGSRDAPVSNCSQSRHPAGKTMLASTPAAYASHAGARQRTDASLAARDFPMARAYAFIKNNQ